MPRLEATMAVLLAAAAMGPAAASLRRGMRAGRRADELRLLIQLMARGLALERAAAGRRWWGVLGIARSASAGEIDTAYRARLRVAHPDTGGTGDGELIDRLRRARQAGLHEAARARRRS